MKKKDELADKNSCLNKANDDEYVFTLRGKDKTSPLVILEWIKANFEHVQNEKLLEAFKCALHMKETPNRKLPD